MFSPEQSKILDEVAESPHLAEQFLKSLTRKDVNKLSARVRAHIEQLDKEKENFPSRIDEFQGLRDTRFIQHNLLAKTGRTWRDLPVEALLQIFTSCVECVKIPTRRTDAVWVLSWTCSRWRGIILNECLFWSNVQVELVEKKGDGDVANMIIKEVYRRGGHCPLRLMVTWNDSQQPAESDLMRLLRSAFDSSSIERICALTLELLPESFLPELETAYFPNLKELSMTVDGPHTEVCAFVRRLMLDRMPCLTHIEFHTSSPIYHASDLFGDAKWTRFIDIKLYYDIVLPFSQVHDRLGGCDQLVSLQLAIGGEPREDARTILPSMPKIHLPSLKNLDIDIYEGTTFHASMVIFCFLIRLNLPSITHLLLTAQCENWKEKITLLSILSDYICTLKTLKSINLVGFKGAHIDKFIAGLPNLQALFLSSPGDKLSRRTIEALESGAQGAQLQRLNCTIATADVGAFVHMLEIQWTNSTQGSLADARGCIEKSHICIEGGSQDLTKKYTNLLEELEVKAGVDHLKHHRWFWSTEGC